MITFLENQQDYLSLLSGFAWFSLALCCWFHRRSLRDTLSWRWFALFATVCGLTCWAQIPLSFLQNHGTHDAVRLCLGVATAFCLYEFAFRSRVWVRSDHVVRWIILPLAGPVIVAAVLEIRVALFVANLAWILPAALLATLAFHRTAHRVLDRREMRWLHVLHGGMICFCIAVGMEAFLTLLRMTVFDAGPGTAGPVDELLIPLALLTVALLLTGGIQYANRSARLVSPIAGPRTHPVMMTVFLVAAGTILIGGWLVTERAGRLAAHHHRKLLRYEADMAAASISATAAATFTGTAADADNPRYAEMKGFFQNMCRVHPELQTVYLVGERDNRRVFLVHSDDHIRPGQPVEASPHGNAALQDLAYVICSSIVGQRPHRETDGQWIGSYAPLLNPAGSSRSGIVGLEFDGASWFRQIRYHRLLGLLLVLALGVGLVAVYVAQRTAHRISARVVAGEEKFRTVFDSATDAICIHDLATGDVLEANRRTYEMMGWGVTDSIAGAAMPFSAHEAPFDSEQADRWIRAAVAGQPQCFEWKAVDRHGRPFWIEVTLQKISIGGSDRLLTVARDIHARKQIEEELRRSHAHLEQRVSDRTAELARAVSQLQADVETRRTMEEQLRESETRFRALAETDTSGILISQDSKFVYANPGAERISGFSQEEILKMDYWAQVHPEFRDLVKQRGEARVRGEPVPAQYTVSIICKSGEEKWIHLSAGTIQYAGRPAVVITFFDITAQKVHETELVRAGVQATQARKLASLGAMAGGIAHDFNNLLLSIMGNAELLLGKLPADSPLGVYLEEIRSAGRRATTIADKMLTYSGRGTFLSQPLDLGRFFHELKPFLSTYSGAQINLAFDLPADLPTIDGDANQLRQALVNLVTNGIEAIGDHAGNVLIRAGTVQLGQAELDTMQLGENLTPGTFAFVEVTDTGTGMDPETRTRIFDPFFTTKFVGRGLGLPAVQGIVKSHHGAIRVESDPGKGTRIRMIFPALSAKSASSPPGPDVPPPRAGAADRRPGEAVLVVDDEEMVRTVVRAILCTKGYKVFVASDGPEALSLFRNRHLEIGLVILDLSMPQMTGEEVLRELKKLDAGVPVILTSGYSEGDVMTRIERTQLAAFIKKPYRADVLLERVQTILGAGAARRG